MLTGRRRRAESPTSAQENHASGQRCHTRPKQALDLWNDRIDVSDVKICAEQLLTELAADQDNATGTIPIDLRNHLTQRGCVKDQQAVLPGGHGGGVGGGYRSQFLLIIADLLPCPKQHSSPTFHPHVAFK